MIIVIGDIHGDFKQLYEGIRNVEERGVTFIQVGDFGLGFESPADDHKILSRINDHLTGKESVMYVIRGNHDNPSFWTPEGRMEFSNIKFVQDRTVMEIEGKQCFFAGGAPSIDRQKRIKGVSFWENECYKHEWFEGDGIDYVFTHEIYHGVSNFTVYNDLVKRFSEKDPTLMQYLLDNQIEMLLLAMDIKRRSENNPNRVKWYHGHYHTSDFWSDGERLDVTSLNIFEFKEVR